MAKTKPRRTAPPPPLGPAFGPPASMPPPPEGLALRLGAGGETLVISTPEGREYELRPSAENMELLIRVLQRQRGGAKPEVRPSSLYTRGQPLDFAPRGDAWRENAFWPRAASGRPLERCPVEVVAHRVGGTVLCTAPDGKTYGLPERWLSPRFTPASIALTLEDLDL